MELKFRVRLMVVVVDITRSLAKESYGYCGIETELHPVATIYPAGPVLGCSSMKNCIQCGATAMAGSRTCAGAKCVQEYRAWVQLGKPICAVCGKCMNNLANACCLGSSCMIELAKFNELSKRAIAGRCQQCGLFTSRRSSQVDGAEDWHCYDAACTWLLAIEKRRHQQLAAELQRDEWYRQAELLKQEMAISNRVPLGDAYAVAVVPHLDDCELRPLADSAEVREFEGHLRRMIQAAFTQPELPSDVPVRVDTLPPQMTDRERPVFHAGCAACRGKCCTEGAGHAFVSISTIRRVMRERPELDALAIEQLYLSHLPERGVVRSCSYHTNSGCALAPALRADMCNHYLCRTLLEVREQMDSEDMPGFFVVAGCRAGIVNPGFARVSPAEANGEKTIPQNGQL